MWRMVHNDMMRNDMITGIWFCIWLLLFSKLEFIFVLLDLSIWNNLDVKHWFDVNDLLKIKIYDDASWLNIELI